MNWPASGFSGSRRTRSPACCTARALAVATASPIDLVVADHGLPGASGADLTRALRSIRPDLHVAIVTGQPDQALAALGNRPVDVVLAKPVGIVDLIHLIGNT